MANREHLQPLMSAMACSDIALWNQWRKDNPGLSPDLGDVDLSDANLRFADLTDANLQRATLTNADISVADLRRSNLSNADLTGANLNGTNLSRADLSGANLNKTSLRNADLSGANLTATRMMGADLAGTRVDERSREQRRGRYWGAISRMEKAALGLLGRRQEEGAQPRQQAKSDRLQGKGR